MGSYWAVNGHGLGSEWAGCGHLGEIRVCLVIS